MAFSEDGRTLASMGTDRVLHYWNPHTEKRQPHAEISAIDRWSIDASIVPEEPHTLPVNTFDTMRQAVSFPGVEDPDGLLASGSSDKTIWLQGFRTLRPLFQIQEQGKVWAVALSPDGQTLASAGDFAGIHLWDLTTISPIHGTIELKSTLAASTARVEGLTFSPDGQTLAVATGRSDGEAIHLWDLRTETIKEKLIAVGVPIRKVAFSPDGQMIAAGAGHTFGGRNVLLWKRGPLSPARIPHSVELDGLEIVTALNKDFTFTVTVKNVHGSILENVVVTLNNPGAPTDWEHNHPTGVWTNSDGEAAFTLRFYDAGQHDIEVLVLNRATRDAALTQQFVDRVEVPKPHSITPEMATLDPIPIPPTSEVASYEDTFIVKSAAGQALEGFQVRISADGVSDTDWTDNQGKATRTLQLSAGIYDVDVAVLDFKGMKVWLEQTFPARVTLYNTHTCSAGVPSLETTNFAKEISTAAKASADARAYQVAQETLGKGTTTSMLPNFKWTPYMTDAKDLGTVVLTVEFLNGTEDDKANVMWAAKQWSDAANIGFWFFDHNEGDRNSDIRVYFDGDEGHNSTVGIDTVLKQADDVVKNVFTSVGLSIVDFFVDTRKLNLWRWPSEGPHRNNETTLNLDDGYSRGTALHELGHAIGFCHSHLVPSFPYTWRSDRDVIYTAYAKSQGWDKKKVDHNLFNTRDLPTTESFDVESIMLYTIDEGHLDDKPEGLQGQREKLSDGDKLAVKNVYEDRKDASDYLVITATVFFQINDGEALTYDECYPIVHETLFVRAQNKEYKRLELASGECDNEVRVVVTIASRRHCFAKNC